MSQDYSPSQQSVAPTSSTAVISLIMSLLGVIGILPIIGSIVGIITGSMARQEIARSGGAQSGEGVAQAGVVIGWLGLALAVIGLCVAFLAASLVVGASLCALFAGLQEAARQSALPLVLPFA